MSPCAVANIVANDANSTHKRILILQLLLILVLIQMLLLIKNISIVQKLFLNEICEIGHFPFVNSSHSSFIYVYEIFP